MNDVFLGEPPANVKQWIIDHSTPVPAGHADTWYKYEGDTNWRTISIKGVYGALSIQDSYKIQDIEFGTDVTAIDEDACQYYLLSVVMQEGLLSIGQGAFAMNVDLVGDIVIPSSVTSIGENAFSMCYGVSNFIFKGKTLTQVQAMENYPWAISDTSIIKVA